MASSPSASATWRRPEAPARVPRFYLHGEGALDFRHEISAILRLAAVAVDEPKMPSNSWQHAADVFVVQHLCVSHNVQCVSYRCSLLTTHVRPGAGTRIRVVCTHWKRPSSMCLQ